MSSKKNRKMETSRKLQKIDSLVLCEYIVKHYGSMSHLKLQKLLFYCDAYHLAYFGTELVSDKFQAWVHGPVSRKVYDSLKDKSILYSELSYSYAPGDIDVDAEFAKLTTDQKDLVSTVLENLSEWNQFQLETAIHRELPWIQARVGYGPADRCEVYISKETTMKFYKSELNA